MPDNTLDIALVNGAEAYDFVYDNADVAGVFAFENGSWQPYQSDNVLIDSVVHPEFDEDGVSEAGTFTVSIPLGQFAEKSSAHVRWDGGDIELSYTLNGTDWNVLTNGDYIPLTASSDLDIRTTFAAGDPDSTAELTRLAVYVLATDTLVSSAGVRDVSFSNTGLSETSGDQTALRPDEGAHIFDGGYIEVSADTSVPATTISRIEFWAKVNNNPSVTQTMFEIGSERVARNLVQVLDFTAGLEVSMDGVPKADASGVPIPLDTWIFYQIDLIAPVNQPFRLGKRFGDTNPTDMEVYGLAVYELQPVGTYEANVSTPTLSIDESSYLTVTETDPAYDIYAYAWSD